MKSFKKIAAILMVALLTMALVAGCQATNAGTEPNKISTLEEEKGKTLTILIPGHNENDESLWQNQVVKAFCEQYPDIKVEFVTADWSNWEEKLMAAYRSGDPIDLINDGVNNNPRFALNNITQPIDPYVDMTNPNLKTEVMNEIFTYGGKHYVAASEVNVAVLYYNKNLFQQEGLEDPAELYAKGEWNWENFVKLAKKLTDGSANRFGFATEYPYLFYGSNATSILSLDENSKYVLNLDDPALIESLEMLQDGSFDSCWSGWEGNPLLSFQKGQAAMFADFQWQEKSIIAGKKFGLTNFEYGVVPMPYGPNNKDNLNIVHSAGWAIGQGSDCPAHVGKLIDMLVNGHAAYQDTVNADLPAENVALYKEMAKKPFCVNTRDSAVGGGYDLAHAVADGQSISQAIEEFKPEFLSKVNEANGKK